MISVKNHRALLTRVPRQSYGAAHAGNKLIQGENLAVLALLERHYAGKVRCIYIDPPYNNQESYNHYVDRQNHEPWLASIIARVGALRKLLTEDGSLWISIDDRELHYLKVAADKIFGRQNFVTTIVWQHRTTRENRKVFSNNHEYLIVYAKNAKKFRLTRNLLDPTSDVLARYKNPDNDPRGPWQSVSLNVQAGHATPAQFYRITAPNGKKHSPPEGRCWVFTKRRMQREIASRNVVFGMNGDGVPRRKKFLRAARAGITPDTCWLAQDVGTTNVAKKQILSIFPGEQVFDTPKPESLIRRILDIATDPGDIVLDAYLGSGTTAAVAHKMKRRYIGIEQGEHAISHCAKRLRSVIDGDSNGISDHVKWLGGGGFEFFRLLNGPRRRLSRSTASR
jgi:adenine-specific DNA-methyltransferase